MAESDAGSDAVCCRRAASVSPGQELPGDFGGIPDSLASRRAPAILDSRNPARLHPPDRAGRPGPAAPMGLRMILPANAKPAPWR